LNISGIKIIAGMPALEARDTIKKCRSFHGQSLQCLAKELKVSISKIKTITQAFEAEGYLEKRLDHKNNYLWFTTPEGNTLARASAAKKYTRATADRNYKEFLGRVEEVNKDDKFLFQVTKVAVFGSYLSDDPTVSDIDIFVWLDRKDKFLDNFETIKQARTKRMKAEGRHFPTYREAIGWPEIDVRKYLKNGSKVIQIEGVNYVAEAIDHKVVYELSPQINQK
jgi:predicted nucleotidyltransferase